MLCNCNEFIHNSNNQRQTISISRLLEKWVNGNVVERPLSTNICQWNISTILPSRTGTTSKYKSSINNSTTEKRHAIELLWRAFHAVCHHA